MVYDGRTRPTSLSLTPQEREALEAMAKAAGTTKTGLVRKWIRQEPRDGELGTITLVLGQEGGAPPGGVAATRKAQDLAEEEGEAVLHFFNPSTKDLHRWATAAAPRAERLAQPPAEPAARRDRAARTGAMFAPKKKAQ